MSGSLRDDIRALFKAPRELWLVYLATFLEYLGIFSFLPTLPLWLSADHKMTDQRAGWWAAMFSLLASLFLFMIGSLVDSIGVRRMLLVSFALCALMRLAMAIAPTPATAVVSLLCFALAYGSTSPVLQTAVQRASNSKSRSFAFSLWYVSFNLAGALVGPFVTDLTRRQFIDPSTGKLGLRTFDLPILGSTTLSAHRAILSFGFVFALLAFLVALTVRKNFEHRVDPEDEQDKKPVAKKVSPLVALREVLSDRPFWRFMVLLLLLCLVRMMFQHMHFTWPKYVTREQGESFPYASLWSVNSFLILFLAPLGTALTRGRRPFDVLLFGAFISAASPFVLCFGSSTSYQLGMILTLTLGEALWSPRLYEYNVSIAPRGREATYVSLAALPYFLAKFLVGPTSGYLLATFCPPTGPRKPEVLWGIVGVLTMIGPIGIWFGRNWITKKTEPAV